MIDFYTWPTPNGRKVHIMLEECGLNYRVLPVDILNKEQFKEAFLGISPNNRIPAIVDHQGAKDTKISVFESGAILLYLAEKCGKLYPENIPDKTRVLEWVMWQMGGLGPMAGQYNHFTLYAPENISYSVKRYTDETLRLLRVLNKQLEGFPYVAGKNYTIADIMIYPWADRIFDRIASDREEALGFNFLQSWLEKLSSRPAVQKTIIPPPNDAIKVLFENL